MKKQETKAWKIIEFIGYKGNEGASLTEIQYYIWTVLDGYSHTDFYKTRDNRYSKGRLTRGHWCTALYGGVHYHTGLFSYCSKNENTKKWRLEFMPAPNTNIYKYLRKDYKNYESPWINSY